MRCLVVVLFLSSVLNAQDFNAIDRKFADFATKNHIPGAAWGIILDGKLVHSRATGYRELSGKTMPTADTLFRIASMTKSFTALSILRLRDEGKLMLDDPVEKYVPELARLKYPTSDSPKITIQHLLSHAGGFPEDNPWGDQQLSLTEERFTELLREGVPFSNAPGIEYEYSNLGFMILGRVVARVSGMSYADYVRTKILRPLGMASSSMDPTSVPPDRLAHGYRWEDEQWKEEPQLSHGAGGPMGGMLTSINDLSKYVEMYLSAWPPHDGPETAPVVRASLREVQHEWNPGNATARRVENGAIQLNASGYGYGLGIAQTCNFRRVVSHGGGLPGFGSLMVWLPEYNAGIIALGNRTYSGWRPVVSEVLDLLAKSGALKLRVPIPSVALVRAQKDVSELVIKWDDALAERIAAMNLYGDEAKERRRAALEKLRAKVGLCLAPEGFDVVENALRAAWTMKCERGQLQVRITLAPTMPPKVQSLSVADKQERPPETCSTEQ